MDILADRMGTITNEFLTDEEVLAKFIADLREIELDWAADILEKHVCHKKDSVVVAVPAEILKHILMGSGGGPIVI